MTRSHVLSGGRYPVLRALAILYVIGAAITCLAGIAAAIYVLFGTNFGGWLDRTFIAVGTLVGAFYFVITLLALAEIIKLAIDVEHNTRVAGAPGRIGMPENMTTSTSSTMGAPAATTWSPATNDGGRLGQLDEETAEAALLRGH